MCTHPFAKKALTLHLARSEGHERYFRCNLMHCKVLASFHQHLTAEAPRRRSPSLYSAQLRTWYFFCFRVLVLAALGILYARTYLGHHHRRISLSARAVQQRHSRLRILNAENGLLIMMGSLDRVLAHYELATSLEGRDACANKRRDHAGMVPADRRLIKFVRADEYIEGTTGPTADATVSSASRAATNVCHS